MNNATELEPLSLRQQWLEQRRSCVCASDIPQLLGYYGSPVQVYLSKVEGLEQEDNDAMMLGRCLEAGIMDMYNFKHPDYGITRLTEDAIYGHPGRGVAPLQISAEYSNHGATPDGFVTTWEANPNGGLAIQTEMFLVEIKHTSRYISEPTDAHVAQVQWQMHVTETSFCDLVYVAAGQYKEFRIERNQEQIDLLIAVADRFWFDYVIPRIPPPPLEPGDAQLLWSTGGGDAIEASDIARGYFHDLKATRERIAALKVVEAEYKSQLQRILKDADTLTIDGEPAITWKRSKDSETLDTKRLKEEHPDIWEKYVQVKPGSRRFCVKGASDE